MKLFRIMNYKLLLIAILTLQVSALNAVTVDGNAYLDGQADHSGIKVKFNPDSPSAVLDSTYTLADGSYSIDVSVGIYDVEFSKEGFLEYALPDALLFSNTTLDDVTLLPGNIKDVSGIISGTWFSDTTYHVVGDVTIENGDTLIIQPGTLVEFTGIYDLVVNGLLTAEGTAEDSIVFTPAHSPKSPGDWGQIIFNNSADDNSVLSYCNIEYAGDNSGSGIAAIEGNAGSIFNEVSFKISHCSIIYSFYNGIRCDVFGGDIIGGEISDNNISYNGYNGIDINRGNYIVVNNEISFNGRNGIALYYGNKIIVSNRIHNNEYDGINQANSGSPQISDNFIYDNGDDNIEVGYHSTPKIINNSIQGAQYGIYIGNSGANPTIFNNIIANPSLDLLYAVLDFGFNEVKYNLFYDDAPSFTGTLPPYFGEKLTVNSNGDSCDIYLNLFQDPQWVSLDPESEFFMNLVSTSPCIDAGNPDTTGLNLPLTDILGNPRIYNDIIDMGAVEYQDTVPQFPVISVNPQVLDFGAVLADSKGDTTANITVNNFGNSNLHISNLSGLQSPFSTNYTVPATILPGHSDQIPIALDKSNTGVFTDTLIIENNDTVQNVIVKALLFNSSTTVVSLISVTECYADTLLIPVKVTNFNDVADFSLVFTYDTLSLEYDTCLNIHSTLISDTLFVNTNEDTVSFSWNSVTGANIGIDTIVELVFLSKVAGLSNLIWDKQTPGACQLKDTGGAIILSLFDDGIVTINANPLNFSVTGGGDYCDGGTGVEIGLDGSEAGVDYELLLDNLPTGNVLTGSGSALNFGYITVAGTYSIIATNVSTGCESYMTGTAIVIINPLPIANLGNDITKCASSTIDITANVSGGNSPYTYLWNTGGTDTIITVSPVIDSLFWFQVIDSNGCQDIDSVNVFIQQVYQGEEVCIVTVDSASQKNLIVWEKTPDMGTAYYKIYKQNTTLIDSVLYDSLSVFVDQGTDPMQFAESYMISTVDSCGNESNLSDHHRTILLTTSDGSPSGINLNWNVYEGFDYDWFYIYRGASPSSLVLIDSVFHANNSPHQYPDLNPPALEFYYRIAVEKHPDSICIPSVGKNLSGPFKKSISNIGDGGESYIFQFNILLEGPYENGQMSTMLNQLDQIPRQQPFNIYPWFYTGEEQVADIPNSMVVDWVLFELRETTGSSWSATSDSTIYRQAAFLLNNGYVVDLDGTSNLQLNAIIVNNLYAVIWHRNHLGVMTSVPLSLSGNLYFYNFSTGPDKVYNGWFCYKELAPNRWGMVAGDADLSGTVDIIDKDSIWAPEAGLKGFFQADFNLDGEVNNKDKDDFWWPNIGTGLQVPE
ncbi:MAG: right-handed parallel beta-helix repeat-containing protein [Bacteroidales bacterium]|nr:right-handed parallel beta-helix repeat-containing protein [Bacteroidales bacterium]